MSERQRVAWVTGGSRGIGQAIAERLAADGFHVLVTYRTDESGAAETVRRIAEAGGSAEAAKADATSREEITAVADRLDAERGGVDVLVNNAAVLKNGLFALMPEASWDEVIDTSLGGTLPGDEGRRPRDAPAPLGADREHLVPRAPSGLAPARRTTPRPRGRSSPSRSRSRPRSGPYGVTVNCVAPGFVETEMISFLTTEAREDFTKRIPLRRFGVPADIAPLVSFLCADGAAYLTGQTIRVDGGFVG